MIFKSFPKFHARHEGLSFYGPWESFQSDKEADTDLKHILKIFKLLSAEC